MYREMKCNVSNHRKRSEMKWKRKAAISWLMAAGCQLLWRGCGYWRVCQYNEEADEKLSEKRSIKVNVANLSCENVQCKKLKTLNLWLMKAISINIYTSLNESKAWRENISVIWNASALMAWQPGGWRKRLWNEMWRKWRWRKASAANQ
jgi:hypothetical protein